MLLYATTIFVSAFLLFQIQPVIGKIILPWFGGTAAVWTTCLLFFQIVLLLGYLYAHWSIQYLKAKQQALLHIALLVISVFVLRIVPRPEWKPQAGQDPTLGILLLLLRTVGLPYFLLSTTGPLLQAWYARSTGTDTSEEGAAAAEGGEGGKQAQPYRLYALSNIGSMLALLSYPVLTEPYLAIRQQAFGWSTGYVIFVLLCGTLAWQMHSRIARELPANTAEVVNEADLETTQATITKPGWELHLFWLVLAALPSVILLAVTNHLSQNVAAIPFLWILPLSLYLLSFIVCFGSKHWQWATAFLPLPALVLAGMAYGSIEGGSHPSLKMIIPLFTCGLFICCVLCHGELARRKPHPRYLTSFYLMISIGGALGGVFVALIAPRLFNDYHELPISIAGCAVLTLFVLYGDKSRLWRNVSWLAMAGLTAGLFWYLAQGGKALNSEYRLLARNFYGVLRISESADPTKDDAVRSLLHGTTLHGQQFLKRERRRHPTTYYGPLSGVGLAVRAGQSSPERVGVIGLGVGTLAAYGRPGDVYRFYDINPLVLELSRTQFDFINDCKAKVTVVLGDARLSLEREPKQNFDVLAVDAFSSDAIPVHLLTREAFELYFQHLKPGGVLAVHVSNRYLDLQPVVQAIAQGLGKEARFVSNDDDEANRITASEWVLVTGRHSFFEEPLLKDAVEPVKVNKKLRMWTDDFSNLYQILK